MKEVKKNKEDESSISKKLNEEEQSFKICNQQILGLALRIYEY